MVRTVISFAEGDGVTLSSAATQEIDQVMQVTVSLPNHYYARNYVSWTPDLASELKRHATIYVP